MLNLNCRQRLTMAQIHHRSRSILAAALLMACLASQLQGQVEAEKTQAFDEPPGRAMAVILVEQDFDPHRDAEPALGDQLRGRRGGDGARTVGAVATRALAFADQFLAVRGHLGKRFAAERASLFVFG